MDNAVEINRLTSLVLEDRKHVNNIPELLNSLARVEEDGQSDLVIENLIKCLGKIFNYFIDTREMVVLCETSQKIAKLNVYKTWLVKLYDTLVKLLVDILRDSNNRLSLRIRKLALNVLMKFVEEEGKFPFRSASSPEEINFPSNLFTNILEALISNDEANHELIADLVVYYQYQDVLHFTMNGLLSILERDDLNDQSLSNIFQMIEPIRLTAPLDLLPESMRSKLAKKQSQVKPVRLCQLQQQSKQGQSLPNRKFKFDYVRDARLFSQMLLAFFRHQLPPQVYKSSLVYLDKFGLQHFENPLELADFLIGSFEVGGIISLCSLSPLYTLMAKCNLEYCKFYHQLYKLLEPAVTYVKHRARFLFWCDLFLTSTHISSKIVASFAKKLLSFAIVSQPDTITLVLPFVGNLLIRHPTIQTMIRFTQIDPTTDPFDAAQEDPELSNAIDSHLWELSLLQSHYEPNIAQMATKILTELPRFEWNLSDLLETTMDDIIEKNTASLHNVKHCYDKNCDIYYLL